jgi:hypothetical protein
MVAAVLVDWVLPFVYNIGMKGFRGSMLAWIFLGGLLAIEGCLGRGNCDESRDSEATSGDAQPNPALVDQNSSPNTTIR